MRRLFSSTLFWLLFAAIPFTQVQAATTESRITFRNNTGVAVDDFHMVFDSNGGNPTTFGLTDRRVNTQAGQPTVGWRTTPPPAGGQNSTHADFDRGTGGTVAPGATGDFWVKNNTNYLRFVEAWWTVGGAGVPDPNNPNSIIKVNPWSQKLTEYVSAFNTNGTTQFNLISADPVPYQHVLVKNGVSVASLSNIANPATFASPTFADFDALVGTTVLRDVDGGTISSLQTVSGPPLAAGTGAFVYISSTDGHYAFAWSDGIVPEPSAVGLILFLGTCAGSRRSRSR